MSTSAPLGCLTLKDHYMTDTAVPAQTEPFFGIQRVYLKGQSLELPQGAQVFLEQGAPAMNLNLQVESAALADSVFEASIRATLTAELNGKVLFLLEVDQAGIFEVRNMDAQQQADVLEIGAPSILAPYLRTQLSDSLTRATLPMFYMPEINWPALAQQRRAEAQAAMAEKPASVH